MVKHIGKLSLLVIIVALSGCYYLQDATVPMPYERYYASGDSAKPSAQVLILLPGIGDYASAYAEQGFIEALQQRFTIDVIAANAHFKYYENRSLIERLAQDIIPLAQTAGYSRIHLGGISLGGYGALLYFRDHPEDLSSVVIFAPYLGEEQHYRDYQLANENGVVVTEDGNLWPWLHSLGDDELIKLYLLYGDDDKFSRDNAVLGKLLPRGHTFTAAGGHDWPTWNGLWNEFLLQDNPFH